ncbi:hypothetical protein MSAN_00259600 [Mycena sanguinolenta]|uniref:Uncharacterized protein n=1 Tax=Mycena sanguinolenta TaxID=230812 RepID=A0A8H6ZKZ8_9AGAR|nr:hypothetical protein MSAN_00259600 [Mycena sanguinolenta]
MLEGEEWQERERMNLEQLCQALDGTCLASASGDSTISSWDIKKTSSSNWVHSVAFSPDETCLESHSYDGTIRLWDAETVETVMEPSTYISARSIAFLLGGTRVLSGSYDKTIRLWDAVTGEPVMELITTEQERERERREREERLERERREQEERQRLEREKRKHLEALRHMQLIQILHSPPKGRLLTLLSSFIFIMLAVLSLKLIGWFIFLGLLVTILAYLLLIILFVAPPVTMIRSFGPMEPITIELGREWERRELEVRLRPEQREQEERQRLEQEKRKRLEALRHMQLIQMLLSPPEGRLLTLLSSFIFIMLAVLSLELIGWFIFLGLLVTILAYLLLIISFVASTNFSPSENAKEYSLVNKIQHEAG